MATCRGGPVCGWRTCWCGDPQLSSSVFVGGMMGGDFFTCLLQRSGRHVWNSWQMGRNLWESQAPTQPTPWGSYMCLRLFLWGRSLSEPVTDQRVNTDCSWIRNSIADWYELVGARSSGTKFSILKTAIEAWRFTSTPHNIMARYIGLSYKLNV